MRGDKVRQYTFDLANIAVYNPVAGNNLVIIEGGTKNRDKSVILIYSDQYN
jgi:hypothetical protein